ncbi:patatin-like phospholipase family protein [Pontivivens ytuae]|uniref:Patatin-like phospholipase family protein n=1 Tax=Pontivivens ytuae TaxID=2789856 RepID=A0A7S9LRJ5_9RHOB|nr:patatin-like phospholipase family protein [Pontivivens ytuae]QPH53794.1 patatin-like phospholipase family protein [Pontivivens ytuae]
MKPSYPHLVFGGGGTRCFWHGGFLTTIAPSLPPTEAISAVSGGALSALAHVTGQEERLLALMSRAFREAKRNGGNISLQRWLSDGDLLVHQDLYRAVVMDLMSAPSAVAAVAEGPAFTVHLARPGLLGIVPTMLAYAIEVPLRGTPHVRFASALGARPLAVDARQAARDGRIVDLTVAAASSRPVFAAQQWDGAVVMDGGVLDNAPCADRGPQLVLVTRPYRNLPTVAGRTYAAPSRKIETFKLDFTDADGIAAAWSLGEEDGRAWLDDLHVAGRA